MCIKLEISQGYTVMHGQPNIKNYEGLHTYVKCNNSVNSVPFCLTISKMVTFPEKCDIKTNLAIHYQVYLLLGTFSVLLIISRVKLETMEKRS